MTAPAPASTYAGLLEVLQKCAAIVHDRAGSGQWGAGLSEYDRCALSSLLRAALVTAGASMGEELMGLPLVCDTCRGTGWNGASGEEADRCGVCEGEGRLPLIGWRRFLPLSHRRRLEKVFAQPLSEL